MNITKKFNLDINGHEEIPFFDIDEIADTKLF